MDRRQTVAALAATIAGALLASPAIAATLHERTRTLLALPRPALDPDNPSFEVFYRLSQWVLADDDPGLDAARVLYPVFMDEPWGPKHIATAFRELEAALVEIGGRRPVMALVQDGRLGEGETWFVSHLLTTWYLGIYYHETRTERLLYEQALMHRVISATHPVPGYSDKDYGFWADAPVSGTAGAQ